MFVLCVHHLAWLGLFFWIYVVFVFSVFCIYIAGSSAGFRLLYLGRNLHLNYIFLFGKYRKETNFVCAESEMNDLCANFNLEVVWLANGSH